MRHEHDGAPPVFRHSEFGPHGLGKHTLVGGGMIDSIGAASKINKCLLKESNASSYVV